MPKYYWLIQLFDVKILPVGSTGNVKILLIGSTGDVKILLVGSTV